MIFRPSGTEDVVRVYAEADTQVNQYDYFISIECVNVSFFLVFFNYYLVCLQQATTKCQ